MDGASCKQSFDCEAEDGKVCGNLCYKETRVSFSTRKNQASTPDANSVCETTLGNGWKIPNDSELCLLLLNCKVWGKRAHQPSFYYVGGTHAYPCNNYVAPNTCKLSNNTQYSPMQGCRMHSYGSSNGTKSFSTEVICIRDK